MRRPRRIGSAVVCIALLAGALASSAAAAPGWLPPSDLSAPGRDAEEPQLAVDAAGNAVAVWTRFNGANTIVQAARRPAGGVWGPPVDLSAAGRNAEEPQLAVDAAGNATAVWTRTNGSHTIVQAASGSPGGTWSGTVDLSLSGRDAERPQVAMDASGRAVAVWQRFDGFDWVVQARTRPPGGAWSSADDVSEPGEHGEEPQVAVYGSGNAVAVWSQRQGTDAIVQSAAMPAGGDWSEPPLDLSTAGLDSLEPQLAVSQAGDAVAVWSAEAGSDPFIQAARRSAAGAWGEPLGLSPAGIAAGEPQVAIDPMGNATAVWTAAVQPGRVVVQAAAGTASGAWDEPVDLSPDGSSDAEDPQVAVDGHGNAAAIWARSASLPTFVEARTRPAGGEWSPLVAVAEHGEDAVEPQVALDPSGDGAAIWSREKGADAIVQAAGFDRAGPQLRGLTIPAAATAGQPAAFAVAPFDVWSGVGATSWQFGDGATGAGTSVQHSFERPGVYPVTVATVDAFGNAGEAGGQVTVFPIARAARIARVRGRRALLRITCPSPAGCRGVVRLIAGAIIERRGRRFGRRVQIGRRAFHVPTQGVATVAVRLTRRGRRLVGEAGRKGLRTQLTGPGIRHRLIILLPPRRVVRRLRSAHSR